MELILVLFSEGDGFFVEVIWWAISSAYNLYVSVICVACVFGPFLPRIGGGGTPGAQEVGAQEDGQGGLENSYDLSRLPNIMYDSSNNRWQKGWTSYDHVTYRNDGGEEVTIGTRRSAATAPRPLPGISTGIKTYSIAKIHCDESAVKESSNNRIANYAMPAGILPVLPAGLCHL